VAGRALPVVVLCHLPHRPSLGGSRVRGAHALGAGGPVPPHLLRAAVLLHRDGARALLGRPVRRAVGSDPPAGPRPRGAAAAGHPPHLHRVRRGRYRHADHGRGPHRRPPGQPRGPDDRERHTLGRAGVPGLRHGHLCHPDDRLPRARGAGGDKKERASGLRRSLLGRYAARLPAHVLPASRDGRGARREPELPRAVLWRARVCACCGCGDVDDRLASRSVCGESYFGD